MSSRFLVEVRILKSFPKNWKLKAPDRRNGILNYTNMQVKLLSIINSAWKIDCKGYSLSFFKENCKMSKEKYEKTISVFNSIARSFKLQMFE